MTTYMKGDRVRHPKMESWGLGLVLEDSDSHMARIFFVEAGEKKVALSHVQPLKVSGTDAESSMLDNLKIDDGKVSIRYKSLAASIEYFLQEFPGGFLGDRFKRHERDHKEKIAKLFQSELGSGVMSALLDAGNYRAVCDRALKLTGAESNAMIFKNEKMALRDGLKSEEAAKSFAHLLFSLLHGTGDFSARFDAFVKNLANIGADKWTIATYFLFFMHPERHMFVKPTITKNAAEVCAFDINYSPEVNARTYMLVMEFSAYLEQRIASLGPKDMIDVQSFMWCIAPGTYGAQDI